MEVNTSNSFSIVVNQGNNILSLPVDCDCIQKILDYLPIKHIHAFSSVNSNANIHCNVILLQRAKKCGFDLASLDATKANRHLETLYFEVLKKKVEKLYCELIGDDKKIKESKEYIKPILDKYICYNSEKGYDFKETLKKLRYIETADLLHIFSGRLIHHPYFLNLRNFFEFETIDLKNNSLESESMENFDEQIWHAYYFSSSLEIFLKREVKINVNSSDSKKYPNETLLHLSIEKGDAAFAKYLLENKAEVDCLDWDNRTPLHIAAKSKNLELIQLLLVNGANPNIVDCLGKVPLHCVKTGGIAKLLLDNGAKTDISADDGYSPIREAKHNASRAKNRMEREDINKKYAEKYAGYKEVVKVLKDHERLIKASTTL